MCTKATGYFRLKLVQIGIEQENTLSIVGLQTRFTI